MGKRKLKRLSATWVAKTKAPGFHPDGEGLYLQVSPSLTKSWVLRYKRDGVTRWMGLGSLNVFGLAEARTRALDARKLLADGIDPLAHRNAAKAAAALERAKSITFDQCASDYIKYFHSERMPLYLLTMFAKGERANLSKAERNDLAVLVKILADSA